MTKEIDHKKFKYVEELGYEIPEEWGIISLNKIANIYSGNTAPQKDIYFVDGKFPFIRVQHLNKLEEGKYPVKYDLINERAILELKLKQFKKGSIIFPKSGESIKLEKRAILKRDAYIANHLAIVEPLRDVDNLFLFYYLSTVKTSTYLTATTMPSLNLTIIQSFLIPLPSLPEQRKIAEILSDIDMAIQKTDELIATTQKLKNGLMQTLLTKGIGHTKFKMTEIGEIPEEWNISELGNSDISEMVKSGGTPLKSNADFWHGEIPFVTIGDMTNAHKYIYNTSDSISVSAVRNSRTFLVPPDSLLISMYGTIGRLSITKRELAISQNIATIIPNKSKTNTEFLFYAINAFSQQFRATKIITLKHLDIQMVKNFKIPLPSLPEQQKIAEILSTVDKKLELERQRKEKLERIKKGLMNDLLTGKVRVKVDKK